MLISMKSIMLLCCPSDNKLLTKQISRTGGQTGVPRIPAGVPGSSCHCSVLEPMTSAPPLSVHRPHTQLLNITKVCVSPQGDDSPSHVNHL